MKKGRQLVGTVLLRSLAMEGRRENSPGNVEVKKSLGFSGVFCFILNFLLWKMSDTYKVQTLCVPWVWTLDSVLFLSKVIFVLGGRQLGWTQTLNSVSPHGQ